jgi:hypothetical protein
MLICPWIAEEDLAQALAFKEGEVLPDDHPFQKIVHFLNRSEIRDHERKHPQFLTNVSVLLLSTMITG